MTYHSRLILRFTFAAIVGLLAAGCTLPPGAGEQAAREHFGTVAQAYRPDEARPVLPELQPESGELEFVRYAVLNHPAIEAAFHDWRAAVATIPIARAQPDPQLTFEADIMERLMTFMPGVMFDFMNSGTRAAMAREMVAGVDVAYRNYLAQIQRTAAAVRKAWVDLAYTDESLELHTAMLHAFDEAAETAAAEYVAGRGMASLETQVRLRNESGMHHADHHATAALRRAARARFKSALGLAYDAPNPPWPIARLRATTLPGRDELWEQVTRANANLGVMRSMVDMAVANVAVAERSGKPDFALGLMVDVKSSPLMVRPTGSVSLPIWREKIAAGIDTARARRDAAAARVSADELMLAAELAQLLYMVQESDEMILYVEETALPNLHTMLATAAAGYESGMSSATMVAETRARALELQGRRLEALRTRETAVAELQFLLGAADQP